jgi:hypothetical protein
MTSPPLHAALRQLQVNFGLVLVLVLVLGLT